MALLIAALLAARLGGVSDTPLNGYYDHQGRYVPGYVSNRTWFMAYPPNSYGRAVFYGPGVMEATAHWRELSLHGYLDGVALMSCRHIGETVWLKRVGNGWEGPFLVADCPRRGDQYSAVVYTDEVVEVGWQTAVRWRMARWVGGAQKYRVRNWYEEVHVWLGDSPPDHPWHTPAAWVFKDYFLENLQFTRRWQDRPIFIPPDEWHWPHGNDPTYVHSILWKDMLE